MFIRYYFMVENQTAWFDVSKQNGHHIMGYIQSSSLPATAQVHMNIKHQTKISETKTNYT